MKRKNKTEDEKWEKINIDFTISLALIIGFLIFVIWLGIWWR